MKLSLGAALLATSLELASCDRKEANLASQPIQTSTVSTTEVQSQSQPQPQSNQSISLAQCRALIHDYFELNRISGNIGPRGRVATPADEALNDQCGVTSEMREAMRVLIAGLAKKKLETARDARCITYAVIACMSPTNPENLEHPETCTLRLSIQSTFAERDLPPTRPGNIDTLIATITNCQIIASRTCVARVRDECRTITCGPGARENYCSFEQSRLRDEVSALQSVGASY